MTIETEAHDYAASREQYDDLVESLADLGYSVELRLASKDRDVVGTAATVFIYLGEHIADAALAAFLGSIFQRLPIHTTESESGSTAKLRKFVLIDADGNAIREVEVEWDSR